MKTWTSWNGNISHPYAELARPTTEERLQASVADSRSVRAFGNRQSSADIAAGTERLISIQDYNAVVNVNQADMQITVQSGITLSALLQRIEALGWCIPCLPDIDTVTLGGAIATGTHGTAGDGHPLSEYMVSCRIVHADGSIESVAQSSSRFPALRCSLGLLGLFSTVTLQCRPLYQLRVEEQPIPDNQWLNRYRRWLDEFDFVRIIWLPHTGYGWVVLGEKISADTVVAELSPPRYVKYRRDVSKLLYRLSAYSPRFTRSANRLLRRLFFSHKTQTRGTLYGATVTKSRASTLELAEWAVAQPRFEALFQELRHHLERNDNDAFAHIPMDIRFLKADQTWLSQAYGGDTVTVGCVTRNPRFADRYRAFDLVESVFLRYAGRPHWAKRFQAGPAELEPHWPHWRDFINLRRAADPEGRFLNSHLRRLFE